ncbi:unnamed protein product [Kuraishia capsulata CBS 1993]|uniref:Ubiquitin carboxyl-terminal hydrolase 2 n=1 Tax=Kuraishia capsulata CBS 1993 TaxID=1382522 RepID=W6MXT9_9ASCO|nr:uncharacterized protein KUCA_T00005453001 [Kuraishia capsulata CBS 1993]CDK29465.1 unnamed protein product [Kuraishia capsulata CBS 1993]
MEVPGEELPPPPSYNQMFPIKVASVDSNKDSQGKDLIDMIDDEDLLEAPIEKDIDTDSKSETSKYAQDVPALPSRQSLPYNLGSVFKTSNRIIDDIKNDMFMILGDDQQGILGVNSVDYAERLSHLKHIHGEKYKLLMLNDFDKSLYRQISSDALGVITSVMAIVMEKETPASVSKISTYHVNFMVKSKRTHRPCRKHRFYKLEDWELNPEDKRDLLLDFTEQLAEGDDSSLPTLIDSATYFCPTCDRMLRVEIFPPEFDAADLVAFEKESVQERYEEYKAKNPESALVVPNQVDCLHQLYELLLQLFAFKTPQENVLLLELCLGRNILKKLNFRESSNGTLDHPLIPETETQKEFVLDAYLRKTVEVLNIGRFFSNSKPEFQVKSGLVPTALLESLDEFDTYLMSSIVADVEDKSLMSQDYITLCSQSYFKDQFIIDTFKELCFANPSSKAKYFDAFTNIAHDRSSPTLWTELATQKSLGVVGFAELRSCYDLFNIDVDNSKVFSTVDDNYLIKAYRYALAYSDGTNPSMYWDAMLKIALDRGSRYLEIFLKTEPVADVERAYSTLEITDSVEDDIVVTAYEIKKDDFPANVELFDRCFLAIAMKRRSMRLFDYVDSYMGHLNRLLPDPSQNLDAAYRFIGCPPNVDDFTFLSCFQEKWGSDLDSRMLYRCLKAIAGVRKSKLVESFSSSGIIDARYLPLANTPCGLNNIGNTCYLNSLLQYYFSVEPLRTAILKFDFSLTQEEFSADEALSQRRIGGRNVSFKETERSIQFVYQLQDLFSNLITSRKRCVTPTRELAYLAFSPSTEEVEFEEEVPEQEEIVQPYEAVVATADADAPLIDINDSDDDQEPEFQHNSPVPGELSSPMDTDDETKTTPNAPTQQVVRRETKRSAAKIDPEQLENALEMGRQQDVTECIENVLFQVESALKPLSLDEDDEQVDLIKQLFYGKTKQSLQPVDKDTKEHLPDGQVRSKIERFLSLLVNIGDHPKDIYDALDTYFTEDLMNLDDGEVKRSLTITELPKILQIQIQRVQFDRERGMPFKSIEPLPFDEKLYMDRYLETEDAEIIQKRKQVFDWKREIQSLSQKKNSLNSRNASGLTALEALEVSKAYLDSDVFQKHGILVDENTISVLDSQIKLLTEELSTIDQTLTSLREKCMTQFKDLKNVGYSIFAIFIHRGEASYGHYWIYIRDPVRDVYRKYNDEIVSEVSFNEVMNFAEGNTATPYFLVFVRDNLENYVDPLKRDLEEEEAGSV